MPYSYPDDIPSYMEKLPAEAQKACVSAYNSTYERTEDEDKSRMACWGAVKNLYEQDAEGKWIRKKKEGTMTDSKDKTKFRYVTDGILLGEAAVGEIQVLKTGTFHHPSFGKFTVTEETLAAMVENFSGELVVDYEHLSAGKVDKPEQGKAAGWIKALIQKVDKLFAKVEWTEEAAEAIRKKEFRYISPEFDFKCKDETGKDIGPALISSALTNRPFLEGMQPVVLSESVSSMLCVEESMYDVTDVVRRAYQAEFGSRGTGDVDSYVTDIFDDYVIVEHGGDLFKLPYIKDESGVTFDAEKRVKVTMEKIYEEVKLTSEERAKIMKDLIVRAAQEAGVGDHPGLEAITDKLMKEVQMDEKKLREILKIGEGDDVLEAVKTLKADVEDNATKLTELQAKLDSVETVTAKAETKLKEEEAGKQAQEALNAGKITPKQVEWATAYALRDSDGFKGFVETAEKVGPELKVKGAEGDETIQLTDKESEIAGKLGVSEEAIVAQKKADEEKK